MMKRETEYYRLTGLLSPENNEKIRTLLDEEVISPAYFFFRVLVVISPKKRKEKTVPYLPENWANNLAKPAIRVKAW